MHTKQKIKTKQRKKKTNTLDNVTIVTNNVQTFPTAPIIDKNIGVKQNNTYKNNTNTNYL